MLLEQLVAKANQPPRYDWKLYYRMFYRSLAGREVTGYKFWRCPNCHAHNLLLLPARYRGCRHCRLTYLPESDKSARRPDSNRDRQKS